MNKKQQLLDKLKKDMIMFGKVITPNMFSAESPAFHYEIAKSLMDNDEKQINIIAPRGHAKSSLVGGIFPMYHLMFDKGPKLIVLVSRTQDHAVKLLGTIKDVFDYSPTFRKMFGYWGVHSAKEWSKSQVKLKDGSMIICKGTGQQLRGIKVGNQRPTLIIVDDPEDENNTRTTEAMENNLRWLLQSAVPSVDPNKGRIAIIGTPQHQNCIVEVLKDMKGWKNMHFAPNMQTNTALWEAWQPIKKLKQKKEELESINRVSVFYREYLCEVVGDEDQLFKEEYVHEYTGDFELLEKDDISLLHIRTLDGKDMRETIPVYTFTGVDPASSTRQTADYSTIVTIAIDSRNRRFVLPYYRKHARPMEMADSILSIYRRYRPMRTRIETVGYQEMVRDYLKRQCEEKNIFIPGLEIKHNPRTAKSARLETMEPYFIGGKVFIQEDMQDLKNELLMYPRGKHDDLLDGLYYAMLGAYKPHVESYDEKSTEDVRAGDRYDWAIL
jgi:predicted phage terminase large subunit-like protein